MRPILAKARFRRDLRRVVKRGCDRSQLSHVVECLQTDRPLEPRHRPHRLSGDWNGWWECHIAPDWLLIYRINAHEELELARTGSHADLFE